MMKDCYECGKPVRLRAFKFKIRGIGTGVHHYIEHVDGSPMHTEEWHCTSVKPYPKVAPNWELMLKRWDGK